MSVLASLTTYYYYYDYFIIIIIVIIIILIWSLVLLHKYLSVLEFCFWSPWTSPSFSLNFSTLNWWFQSVMFILSFKILFIFLFSFPKVFLESNTSWRFSNLATLVVYLKVIFSTEGGIQHWRRDSINKCLW